MTIPNGLKIVGDFFLRQSSVSHSRSGFVLVRCSTRKRITLATFSADPRGYGRFNTHATSPYTVAHKTRPCGSSVRITNLSNGKSITAIVTDRGPYIKGRCVDLGRAGANAIGMGGLARVRVE